MAPLLTATKLRRYHLYVKDSVRPGSLAVAFLSQVACASGHSLFLTTEGVVSPPNRVFFCRVHNVICSSHFVMRDTALQLSDPCVFGYPAAWLRACADCTQVYACGFGSKGVLGTGDANPQLLPTPLTQFCDSV